MANSDTLSPAHRGEWRVIIGSIRPAWLLKMLLISGMKLLENGLKAMTNNFLVVALHKQAHGTSSIIVSGPRNRPVICAILQVALRFPCIIFRSIASPSDQIGL